MQRWSESEYVIAGRFSSPNDLEMATAELVELSRGPVVLATYSANALLPALSRIVVPNSAEGTADDLRMKLNTSLQEGLSASTSRMQFVAQVCTALLAREGVNEPTVAHFGHASDRPGELAVTILSMTNSAELELKKQRTRLAMCVMSSRSAAFHRENAQDLAIRSAYREANELLSVSATAKRDDLSAIADAVSASRVDRVIGRARELLSVRAVVVYESKGDHLGIVSLSSGAPVPNFDVRVAVDEKAAMPVAPELGGSHFRSMAGIVSLCWVLNRKLYGSIDGGFQCVGWPFGGSRPVAGFGGVVGIVWSDTDPSPLGAHELGQLHSVVRNVERALSDKGRTASVGTIGNELRLISESGTVSKRRPVPGLSSLAMRRDVQLTTPTVRALLRFLIELTGAISATCRLLSGVAGALFERSLVRVDCQGDDCALNSPESIPLDRHSDFVNAWVGVHGQSVYLRSVREGGSVGEALASDLSRYDGLESISFFRPGMRSELCVPIFAEGRLVGTVNLESNREWAFDLTAEVVAECAQVIGIALLESRRRIGVELMIDAGGFLDKRHELERMVRILGTELKGSTPDGDSSLTSISGRVDDLVKHIYMHKHMEFDDTVDEFTVREVLTEAMRSVSWTFAGVDLWQFSPDPKETFDELLATPLRREQANALRFAVAQAIVNTRTRGHGATPLVPWKYPIRLSLLSRSIGGVENIYVALSSLASVSSVEHLDSERVFREPINLPNDDRTRVGAYIAGEILRRCGGSAYFRVEPNTSSTFIVTAEYSVPARGEI